MANTDYISLEDGSMDFAHAWLEDGDEPICVKVASKSGDPLDLSVDEVKKIITMLQTLVDKVEAHDKLTQ